MHYILHTRYFWWIHKTHHKAHVSYGVDALYMHPIESILTITSLLTGAFIWSPSSNYVIYDLIAISLKNTMWSHMNSVHTNMPSPIHYLHHKYGNVNYGSIFLDYVFRTRMTLSN